MKEITHKILESIMQFPDIHHYQLSETSRSFLKNIFSLFQKGLLLFSTTTIIENNYINYDVKSDTYIPVEIRDFIDKNQKIRTDFLFTIASRKFTISMHHFHSISKSTLNRHCKRIFMWLYVCSHFAPLKCSQKVQINIFFTNKTKLLPETRSPLKQNHANTAFTTSCSVETEINIFREEEWFKVLIHETFHCFGLDFSEMDKTRTNAQILTMFHVQSDVRLFETYCEVWAETINVMFISFFSTRNLDISKMLTKTEKMLYYERKFSLLQCAKILHHFDLTYQQLCKNSKQNHKYKEETQILSYYVLKAVYLFYVSDFIDWCLLSNGKTLNFYKRVETIESYVHFMREHYQRPEFLKAMKSMENIKLTSSLAKTMRMTVFELE